MILIRLLLLLLIAFVVYRLYRLFSGPRQGTREQPTLTEDMVRCTVCGVHLPRTRALADGTDWFCCEEHRRQRNGQAPGT
jgi:uncharacterized protein